VPVHELFREGKQGAAVGTKEDSFLRLIAGYLRKVDAADRDLVLAVANRLAKKDP
jgi:hypothetical protein